MKRTKTTEGPVQHRFHRLACGHDETLVIGRRLSFSNYWNFFF
jgi:hypothetical protein